MEYLSSVKDVNKNNNNNKKQKRKEKATLLKKYVPIFRLEFAADT